MKMKKLWWLSLMLIIVVPMVAACLGGDARYRGRLVAPEHRVSLADDRGTGLWETFDMAIRYEYLREGDSMTLSGVVTLSEHYQLSYDFLKKLDLELVLLDRDSRVVMTRDLDVGRPLGVDWQVNFTEQVPVTETVAAFSFAYDGVVRGDGEDHGGAVNFWLIPRAAAKE